VPGADTEDAVVVTAAHLRNGRALCIGVEAEADALAFAGVAKECGFGMVTLLLGEHATRGAVRSAIARAAASCRPGDFFLLTFSGHGGRRKIARRVKALRDATGRAAPASEDASERVSAWSLYDGSFIDEEISADLARFRRGVRVLVVSDNCCGGIPSERAVPAPSLLASVLVLTACQPDQYADAEGLPGHFATALLDAWRGGDFAGSYADLHAAIRARMPGYQTPQLYGVGVCDPEFAAQKPFTL